MKKYISRAVGLILFFVVLVAIYAGFDYVISDNSASQTRVTFHDYYEAGKIDYLFIGPSHSVHEINAVKLSEDLDKNVFNLSTAGQDFIGAYFLVEEAVALNKTDHIFLELSVSRLNLKTLNETAIYIIADYLKSPLIKAKYLTTVFDSSGYINSFLPLRRYIDPQKLPTASAMTKNYRAKQEPAYADYAGTEKYIGKGQWIAGSSWADTATGTAALNLKASGLNKFTLDDIQDEQVTYLRKIIQLCKDNGIELTFTIPPYSELYLINFEQYEAVTQIFYDIAAENDIPIVDFNKVKDEYLTFTIADFYNPDHASADTSPRIADFLATYIRNPDGDYFYDSLEDKHPINDDIIAVAYNRFFVTKEGEYAKAETAKGDITSLRLEVSALSRVKRPVNVRLWQGERSKDDEPVWHDLGEFTGEKLDAYTTQFVIPYNNLKTDYRVALLDPDTNEVLYETFTRFDMK